MSALWLYTCFVLVVLESRISIAIASTNDTYAMPILTLTALNKNDEIICESLFAGRSGCGQPGPG